VTEPEWSNRYWYPVSWAAEVRAAPLPVTLLGTSLVLWRDGSTVLASRDRCPHRGTALSLGEVDDEGCLVCPYHGWHYDRSGACVQIPQLAAGVPIPPRARLAMVRCEERHGLVWICLDEPVEPIPDFPEYGDTHYRHVPCPTYRWTTSPGRMVENFTDFGHLGYLHDGLLGTRDDLVVPGHKVDQVGGALHYTLSMQVPNTNEQFTVTDVRGERGLQTNRYVLTLPYTIHLACTYEDTGSHRTLFFSVQPHGDGTCTGYCYQSRDFDLEGDDDDYAKFQELLAQQDQPIVESQLPAELPLGPTDELQLPFDRVAIAYRRALAGLARKTSACEGDGRDAPDVDGPVGDRTEYPNYVETRS
jgi:phenylpropionate dioxygenase-like ring-hydroxylating dioxygenase large terminal subunit